MFYMLQEFLQVGVLKYYTAILVDSLNYFTRLPVICYYVFALCHVITEDVLCNYVPLYVVSHACLCHFSLVCSFNKDG